MLGIRFLPYHAGTHLPYHAGYTPPVPCWDTPLRRVVPVLPWGKREWCAEWPLFSPGLRREWCAKWSFSSLGLGENDAQSGPSFLQLFGRNGHNEACLLFLFDEKDGHNEACLTSILWEKQGVMRPGELLHLWWETGRMLPVLTSVFGRMKKKPAGKRALLSSRSWRKGAETSRNGENKHVPSCPV